MVNYIENVQIHFKHSGHTWIVVHKPHLLRRHRHDFPSHATKWYVSAARSFFNLSIQLRTTKISCSSNKHSLTGWPLIIFRFNLRTYTLLVYCLVHVVCLPACRIIYWRIVNGDSCPWIWKSCRVMIHIYIYCFSQTIDPRAQHSEMFPLSCQHND